MLNTLPVSLRTFYGFMLNVMDINLFSMLGLSCANHEFRSFASKLLCMVIAPVIVSGLLYAVAHVQVRVLGRDEDVCFGRYVRLQLLLLFLVLPATSTTIFRAFLCDGNFGVEGANFLEADYKLSCDSDEYQRLRVVAIVGIIMYPIGVNVLYATLLWRSRGSIRHDGADITHLSFLYQSYKPEYFFYEVVDSVRRIVLTGALVFVPERDRAAVATLLALCFLLVHEETKPFKEWTNNVIASIANACVRINLRVLNLS